MNNLQQTVSTILGKENNELISIEEAKDFAVNHFGILTTYIKHMYNQNKRIVEINTTSDEEENMVIFTDLTDDEIAEVVNPIVNTERDGYEEYDNEILLKALKNRFKSSGKVIELAIENYLSF